MEDDYNPNNIGWYVSDRHCNRAIGYLSVDLVERGYLNPTFESPILLEMWGEALKATMDVNEPSPIGPDPELAERIIKDGRSETASESRT
jgi:hypothetical protein